MILCCLGSSQGSSESAETALAVGHEGAHPELTGQLPSTAQLPTPHGDEEVGLVALETLHEDVSSGDILLLNDGMITLAVDSIDGTRIHTTVVNGGILSENVDTTVIAPSKVTARIQEAHIFILHLWADIAESALEADEGT